MDPVDSMRGERNEVMSFGDVPHTTTPQQPLPLSSDGGKGTHRKGRAMLLVLLVVVVVAVPSSIGVLWFTSLHSTSIQCQLGVVSKWGNPQHLNRIHH